MKISRRTIRVVAVLAVAVGTGHFLQNSDAIAARLGVGQPADDDPSLAAEHLPMTQIAILPAPVAISGALDFVPAIAEIRPAARKPPVLPPAAPLRLVSLDTATDAGAPPGVPAPPSLANCAPSLTLAPAPAAVVLLTYAAPCAPGAEVRISHAGLTFDSRADAQGTLRVAVPALMLSAEFTAAAEGSAPISARIEMPTLVDYDRVAVTWQGEAAIELHAFEFGAGYDDDGHVWRGHPRNPAFAISALGGFSTFLGDAGAGRPAFAEIYTFPAGRSARAGSVALTLEAEVTAATCGSDIAGRTLTALGGAAPSPVEVTLAMPECDTLGDYLVLNNLFDDLKIAAR